MVVQKLSLFLIIVLVAVVIAKPRKRELHLEARAEPVAVTDYSDSHEGESGTTPKTKDNGQPALPRLPQSNTGGGYDDIPTEAIQK
ncbi:hypothetical protein MRX96_043090 [Rhipicephalus microplus]|uniref:Putative secreted protein n=1 Tax=Rhipicephalus microplus TaxID=6941 RepID=A0A6G5A7L3_RHIMP